MAYNDYPTYPAVLNQHNQTLRMMPHSHPRPNPESQWLATSLSTLLKSPHIVLDESPLLPLAPGPVDIFTVKFDQLFTPDARGYVCGKEVDRKELKETLLGLQRRWNAADSSCAGCVAHPTHITEFHVRTAASHRC